MRITEQEAAAVFSALYDQASSKESEALMLASIEMVDFTKDIEKLNNEAAALRELASKIIKAQEADDHGVPA